MAGGVGRWAGGPGRGPGGPWTHGGLKRGHAVPRCVPCAVCRVPSSSSAVVRPLPDPRQSISGGAPCASERVSKLSHRPGASAQQRHLSRFQRQRQRRYEADGGKMTLTTCTIRSNQQSEPASNPGPQKCSCTYDGVMADFFPNRAWTSLANPIRQLCEALLAVVWAPIARMGRGQTALKKFIVF